MSFRRHPNPAQQYFHRPEKTVVNVRIGQVHSKYHNTFFMFSVTSAVWHKKDSSIFM